MLMEGQESGLVLARQPEIILEEARNAAAALKKVIDAKPNPVLFNGEKYLEFEDWQTVGRFYGIAPKVTATRYVTFGDVSGWESSADAVHVPSGRVVSSADAMCLNDEDKWRARPKYAWVYCKKSGGTSVEDPGKDELIWEQGNDGKRRPKKSRELIGEESVPSFQLRSMAQTRAGAKALRNALAWVVVLAGYRPTPAEELPGRDEDHQRATEGGTHAELEDEREGLLKGILDTSNALGLKSAERAALWEKHVGAGRIDPREADPAALAALLAELKGRVK